VVSFTLQPLYPQGESPWYPLDRRLSGPQSRSGRGGEEAGLEPPIIHPIAQHYTTELSWSVIMLCSSFIITCRFDKCHVDYAVLESNGVNSDDVAIT
jgi:hypothetical protein